MNAPVAAADLAPPAAAPAAPPVHQWSAEAKGRKAIQDALKHDADEKEAEAAGT